MDKNEIKLFLEQKPGYKKFGKYALAKALGIENVNDCGEVLKEFRSETSNKGIDELSELMKRGEYDKALDLVNQAKNSPGLPKYIKKQYSAGNYVVLGCLHLPWVNEDFFAAVLKLIKDCPNLKGIVLAGDILDMSSISRHAKGLMPVLGYDLAREYKEANEYLDRIDEAIGSRKVEKEYFYGNHEDWYLQYTKQSDNSKLGHQPSLSPYHACFEGRGYNFQKDWRNARVIIGDTEIIHGMWCATHSAYKHLTTLRRNLVFFHTHRFNTHLEGGLSAYNCGFGGDRTAPVFNYMSGFQKEAWTNGLAVINLGEDNISRVTAIPYNDGLFFNNKLYKND